MQDLKAVHGFLKAEATAGRISSYGPLQGVSNLSDCHVVVCDSIHLKPIAILSTEDSKGLRVNLTTNQTDSLGNYHGTYMIGYVRLSD